MCVCVYMGIYWYVIIYVHEHTNKTHNCIYVYIYVCRPMYVCMHACMQSFCGCFVNNTFGLLPEYTMVMCNQVSFIQSRS